MCVCVCVRSIHAALPYMDAISQLNTGLLKKEKLEAFSGFYKAYLCVGYHSKHGFGFYFIFLEKINNSVSSVGR